MTRRRRWPAAPAAGRAAEPLNLIHRNNSPNPASMRVSGRFDYPNGIPITVLGEAMKLPLNLAIELLRRAKQ